MKASAGSFTTKSPWGWAKPAGSAGGGREARRERRIYKDESEGRVQNERSKWRKVGHRLLPSSFQQTLYPRATPSLVFCLSFFHRKSFPSPLSLPPPPPFAYLRFPPLHLLSPSEASAKSPITWECMDLDSRGQSTRPTAEPQHPHTPPPRNKSGVFWLRPQRATDHISQNISHHSPGQQPKEPAPRSRAAPRWYVVERVLAS